MSDDVAVADAAGPPDAEDQSSTDADPDAAASAGGDPVRAYLRTLTPISLLTREGEVEIAKRIEDGQRRVLRVVLGSSLAIDEILSLRDELRQARVRVR